MSLLSIWQAANNEDFRGRCQAALWVAANAITNEDPQTANHEQRLSWATQVLRNRDRISAHELVIVVMRGAAIGGLPDPTAASDADIQAQVTGNIPLLMSL